MASLYRDGWRQGSVLNAALPLAIIDETGALQYQEHGEWLVVTQECDLDGADSESAEPLIELRPIYPNPGGHAVGIRSEVFVLDANRIVRAQSPRTMIAPKALSTISKSPKENLLPRRATLLKTWLGRRYDRPAVPDEMVPLAKSVAAAVSAHKGEVADLILDVLMRLEPGNPPAVGLYAVTEDDGERDRVEDWLQGVAGEISPEVGTVKETQSVSVRRLSLWTVQNTYSANVSQLSITKADKREM